MNYELAKELKEAGFPQTPDRTALYPRGYCLSGTKAGLKQSEKDRAIPPTLSELIEACGKEFYSVVRAREKDWRAFSETDEANTVATADGSTPEEAVARLWLALNPKA